VNLQDFGKITSLGARLWLVSQQLETG
jgi:hypothetical protein